MDTKVQRRRVVLEYAALDYLTCCVSQMYVINVYKKKTNKHETTKDFPFSFAPLQ